MSTLCIAVLMTCVHVNDELHECHVFVCVCVAGGE